jgi:hypothetical protein
MSDRETHNPATAAAELKANPLLVEAKPASINYSASLTNNGGFYKLNWSADVIQKYDWVGLYPNADVPDSSYITGDNWQWAEYDNSYKTATPVSSGYQARYLVWDYVNGSYVAVAVSSIL